MSDSHDATLEADPLNASPSITSPTTTDDSTKETPLPSDTSSLVVTNDSLISTVMTTESSEEATVSSTAIESTADPEPSEPTSHSESTSEAVELSSTKAATVEITTSEAESESTTSTETTQSTTTGNLQVPPVNRPRRTDPDHFQFELVDEEFNWAASGMQTPSDLGEVLGERSASSVSSSKAASIHEQAISELDRVHSLDSEGNWSESETASLIGDEMTDNDTIDEDVEEDIEEEDIDEDIEEEEEEAAQEQEEQEETVAESVVDIQDIVTPVHSTDIAASAETNSSASISSSTGSLEAPIVDATPSSGSNNTLTATTTTTTTATEESKESTTEESAAEESADNEAESLSSNLLKTPKAAKRTNQLPEFTSNNVTPKSANRILMDKPSFRPISEESPPLESLETESPPSFFVCNDDPLTESRGRSLKFVVPTSSKTASSTTTTTTTTTVSGEAPSKAPSTADEGERTAIHMGDDHETSTLGDLSSILHEPIPEVVQDISLDGEVEIEEEVDEAVVAAAKIATVVAASPHRRRREVETPELYASVALVVQQQQEEARRTRLSISEPRGQIEAQFINRLQESINAANAASSVSPNTSAPQALLTSENDFDTVTSVLDSHARMSSSLPALNNMHRSLGSSMLRANSNEDKLTALLLQPSSLESLRKIVPAPETTLSRLSVVLAGDAPDEMSRQHVLRAFARALHTGGKGGSAIGNLDEYANIAQYGLHVTDVTGTTAQAQQQAAIRHSELCVYFLRPPVSKSQLDGAADCARQITILPVCLSQGERLYADQRLITRGLTQRKVANTVLTPGTTSTVMQLAEMHPATLAFSLQLAQERTVTERAANKRQRIRFILSMIMLFLTSLFILVILPGEGSTGRDALDAALPVAWSRWLARWSPFTGLSSSSSPSLQSTYPHYYDTVYYHEGTEDDDPHADWIYAPDNVIIEELPEYETLPPQSAKMEGGSNGKPTDEKKETEEEEEIPDDLFSWFASMTRRLSQYLKKEELPQKKGVVGMGVRTIVEWIDTLFGVEEEEHEEEKQATQADTTEEERQQQQRHRRRRRIRIRRTRHRTYELGMRGNLHWVMDVGLDAMDDARIWLFRTTEPLRRELLYQLKIFQKTALGQQLMAIRQALRDQLAKLIKRM